MSKQLNDVLERGQARIVEAPAAPQAKVRHQVEVDRNFELPRTLYAATAGLYFAFIALMFAGFSSPGLIIPVAIFGVLIAAGFGVPAVWTRLKGNESSPLTMGKFRQAGIMTHTGLLKSRDAAIQMLILPVLIVVWGCITIAIAALV